MAQTVKNQPAVRETWVQSLDWEDPLEEGTATHSSIFWSFSGSSVGKESACSVGELGLIPGSGRSSGERNSYPLQYSCPENSMDRGAWWATVHGVARVGYNLDT